MNHEDTKHTKKVEVSWLPGTWCFKTGVSIMNLFWGRNGFILVSVK